MNKTLIKKYKIAEEFYQNIDVDINNSLNIINTIPISIHCWQGDDLKGFENQFENLYGGGILATGNFLGRARNIEELQSDIGKAFSLIPGKKIAPATLKHFAFLL